MNNYILKIWLWSDVGGVAVCHSIGLSFFLCFSSVHHLRNPNLQWGLRIGSSKCQVSSKSVWKSGFGNVSVDIYPLSIPRQQLKLRFVSLFCHNRSNDFTYCLQAYVNYAKNAPVQLEACRSPGKFFWVTSCAYGQLDNAARVSDYWTKVRLTTRMSSLLPLHIDWHMIVGKITRNRFSLQVLTRCVLLKWRILRGELSFAFRLVTRHTTDVRKFLLWEFPNVVSSVSFVNDWLDTFLIRSRSKAR